MQWTAIFSTKAHGKAISALAIYGDLVITGGSDSLVKVWKINSCSDKGRIGYRCMMCCVLRFPDELSEVQTINLKNRYPLSIDVARLPRSQGKIY